MQNKNKMEVQFSDLLLYKTLNFLANAMEYIYIQMLKNIFVASSNKLILMRIISK